MLFQTHKFKKKSEIKNWNSKICGKHAEFFSGDRRLRVFDNMVLRRIFGPRRDEMTVEWRKLYSEEVNDLCCSPHIVRVIKSRRKSWAGM